MFDEMCDEDVIFWSVIISGYVQNEEAQVGYVQNDSVFIFCSTPFLLLCFLLLSMGL